MIPSADRRARRDSADRERQGRQAPAAGGRARSRRRSSRRARRARPSCARSTPRCSAGPRRSISVDASFLELGGHSLKAAVLLSAIYHAQGRAAASSRSSSKRSSDRRGRHASSRAGARRRGRRRLGDARRSGRSLPLTSSQRADLRGAPAVDVEHRLQHPVRVGARGRRRSRPARARARRSWSRVITRCARSSSSRTACRCSGFAPTRSSRSRGSRSRTRASTRRSSASCVRSISRIAPLVRVALIVRTETRRVLALDVHHIVADGLSVRVLLEDLEALYAGEPQRVAVADVRRLRRVGSERRAGRAQRDAERSVVARDASPSCRAHSSCPTTSIARRGYRSTATRSRSSCRRRPRRRCRAREDARHHAARRVPRRVCGRAVAARQHARCRDRRAGRRPPSPGHGAAWSGCSSTPCRCACGCAPTSHSPTCACGSAPKRTTRSNASAISSTTSSPTSASRAIRRAIRCSTCCSRGRRPSSPRC